MNNSTQVEFNAIQMMEKDLLEFLDTMKEKMGGDMPDMIKDLIVVSYKCGYQDGCVSFGEVIATTLDNAITIDKNIVD